MYAGKSCLQRDIADLRDFAYHTFGRLQLVYCDHTHVKLRLNCRSATKVRNAREPEISELEHRIDLFILSAYPAEPVVALHKHPEHVFHPNIASLNGLDPSPVQRVIRGFICFSSHHSPQRTLVDVVCQVYDVLGYRSGRLSTDLSDCLNREAVVWANRMAETGLFPLERRYLRVPEGDK